MLGVIRKCSSSAQTVSLASVYVVISHPLLPTFLLKMKTILTYLTIYFSFNVCLHRPLIRKLSSGCFQLPEHYFFSVHFKINNTRSSTENCGLGLCTSHLRIQFFCFLLHSESELSVITL